MNELFVEIDNPTIDQQYSYEQYGPWSRTHNYRGCRVYAGDWSQGSTTYRKSLEVDFDVVPGTVVYPVLVEYRTGDSFGQSYGNIELVAIFNSLELAEGLRSTILHYDYGYDLEYEGETYYACWRGYFERLEQVHVETEVVRV